MRGTATGTGVSSPAKSSRGRKEMPGIYYRKENQLSARHPGQQEGMPLLSGHAGTDDIPHADCLSSVMVPRTASTRDITVLETAMQGLALDARHPVALEVGATATSRHFLLRATTPMALRHLEDQVRARYPQALIHSIPAQDDPLLPRENELVSAVELRPGAAA